MVSRSKDKTPPVWLVFALVGLIRWVLRACELFAVGRGKDKLRTINRKFCEIDRDKNQLLSAVHSSKQPPYEMMTQFIGKHGDSVEQANWQNTLGTIQTMRNESKLLRGIVEAAGNDHSAAIQELEAYIASNPSSKFAHSFLGTAYRKAGRYDESLSALRKQLELTETDQIRVVRHIDIAETYIAMQDYDSAIAELETTLANAPAASDNFGSMVYLQLGIAYNHKGNYKDARRTWNQAIRQDRLPKKPLAKQAKQLIAALPS